MNNVPWQLCFFMLTGSMELPGRNFLDENIYDTIWITVRFYGQ